MPTFGIPSRLHFENYRKFDSDYTVSAEQCEATRCNSVRVQDLGCLLREIK